MSSVIVVVENPGMFTTVQDLGRKGWQHAGIPLGGALDRTSARLANKLVGNSANEPVLELTILGPRLRFETDAVVAIVGSWFSPEIDGKSVENESPIEIKCGQALSFSHTRSGARAYLAIQGRWCVSKWLQSASFHPGIPFLVENRLKKEQIIRIENAIPLTVQTPENYKTAKDSSDFRILPAQETHLLTQKEKEALVSTMFLVSAQSNRAGCRLEPFLHGEPASTRLLSAPVLPGMIQRTSAGQLILLLADGPTIGGYERVALLHPNDLDRAGQLKPGDSLEFTWAEED